VPDVDDAFDFLIDLNRLYLQPHYSARSNPKLLSLLRRV